MTVNEALTQVDTQDPVYTIEHVAALFHVKVDTAREYTYRQDFPPTHQLGARLLWEREDILAWSAPCPDSPLRTASPAGQTGSPTNSSRLRVVSGPGSRPVTG